MSINQYPSPSLIGAAALSAAKGKKKKPRVAAFIRNLESEVIALEKELLTKTYRPRPYRLGGGPGGRGSFVGFRLSRSVTLGP